MLHKKQFCQKKQMLNSLSVDYILTRSTWSLICQRHGHVVMCNKNHTSDEHRLLYQQFSIFMFNYLVFPRRPFAFPTLSVQR